MNLRIFDDADTLTRAAARTLLQQNPSSVAISGGSTPRPLFELLGGEWREQIAAHPITWVIVDERWVPKSDPQSNAAMIERTLFSRGLPETHRFLEFRTDLADAAASAAQFERDWTALGLETLDVVILGCGDDGHTASLFPGTHVLDVDDRIASEVFVPRLDQWRVTLTMPIIRAAKLRIVLATGDSKASILRDVREGVQHPIARATVGVETWWFVDRAAAGG